MYLLCDQEGGFEPAPRRGLVRVAATAAGAAGAAAPAAAALLGAAGGSTGGPGVVGRSAAALLAAAGATAPAAALLAATATAEAAATALAATAGGLGDLGRGVAQAGADFLDVQLVDRALDALTVLVGPLLQPALHEDAHAPLERLGDVLRRLTPDRAGQEQALAVLPLVRLAVEGTGSGRDTELRDRRTGGGEAQLGVIDKVADDRDDGLACHGGTSRRVCCCWLLVVLLDSRDRLSRRLSGSRDGGPWSGGPTRSGSSGGRAP